MESLSAYGSDDEDQPRAATIKEKTTKGQSRKEDDTNYDHVTMDMSEESNNNNSDYESSAERGSSSEERTSSASKNDFRHSSDCSPKRFNFENHSDVSYPTTSREPYVEKYKLKEPDFNEDFKKFSEYDKDNTKRNDRDFDKRGREDKKERDYTDRKDRRHDSDKDKHNSYDKYEKKHSGDDRRKRERSKSRDKSYSSHRRSSPGSDRDKYRHRYSESSKRRSGSRERRGYRRSRSKSPMMNSEYKPSYKVSKKLQAMDKMGLQIKTPDGSMATAQMLISQTMVDQVEKVKNVTGIELPKYYNPAAMNPLKYANQIQKRKLLWGNKNKEAPSNLDSQPNGGCSSRQPTAAQNKWQGTKFAQDSDGKVANKFMRLMGIKNPASAAAATTQSQTSEPTGDIVKKQEEMFEVMQAQYEVARVTTHTMRGVGLGFSSHNKPF